MMKQKQNLETLQLKRKQLQADCKLREDGLNTRIHYLEDNFGSMLVKSISPFDKKQTDSVDNMLDVVNDVIASAIPSLGLNKEKSGKIIKVIEMLVLRLVYKKVKDVINKKTDVAV